MVILFIVGNGEVLVKVSVMVMWFLILLSSVVFCVGVRWLVVSRWVW